MNEDAGNGGTRLDAAKRAVDVLLDRLPPGAPLGLRVYGSKVAETSRAEACRDTELVVPVGPLDKDALRGRVQALTGKGRTPIGSSLLRVPDDLGSSDGRRTVILVSDGGDNCAPPDPCEAAREVSRQGVDLSISVVGLQVNERVRRQLECIAKAGGGTYVGVDDADELADELAAALARAFRSYEPAGTKVTGGTGATEAAPLQGGLFQDSFRPGEKRWYAVDVPEGRSLLASVSAIPSHEDRGQSALRTELLDPGGERVDGDAEVLYGQAAGEGGRVRTQSLLMPDFAGAPGRYTFSVEVEAGLETDAVPVEIGVQLLQPGETPGLTRAAGELGAAVTPTPTPSPAGTPVPEPVSEPAGSDVPLLAGIGVAGAALGLVAALALTRRRTA